MKKVRIFCFFPSKFPKSVLASFRMKVHSPCKCMKRKRNSSLIISVFMMSEAIHRFQHILHVLRYNSRFRQKPPRKLSTTTCLAMHTFRSADGPMPPWSPQIPSAMGFARFIYSLFPVASRVFFGNITSTERFFFLKLYVFFFCLTPL